MLTLPAQKTSTGLGIGFTLELETYMQPADVVVLVIEDVEALRLATVSDLEEIGYKTVSASNGYEALEKLRLSKVDIVLSDLKMPELSGIQVLKMMRSAGHFQPFIVISGFGTRAELVELLRLGAFDFLEKPVDFEVFKSVVAKAAELTTEQAKSRTELIKTLGISEAHLTPQLEQSVRQIARLKTFRESKKTKEK